MQSSSGSTTTMKLDSLSTSTGASSTATTATTTTTTMPLSDSKKRSLPVGDIDENGGGSNVCVDAENMAKRHKPASSTSENNSNIDSDADAGAATSAGGAATVLTSLLASERDTMIKSDGSIDTQPVVVKVESDVVASATKIEPDNDGRTKQEVLAVGIDMASIAAIDNGSSVGGVAAHTTENKPIDAMSLDESVNIVVPSAPSTSLSLPVAVEPSTDASRIADVATSSSSPSAASSSSLGTLLASTKQSAADASSKLSLHSWRNDDTILDVRIVLRSSTANRFAFVSVRSIRSGIAQSQYEDALKHGMLVAMLSKQFRDGAVIQNAIYRTNLNLFLFFYFYFYFLQ
jgi:hypothetical protein